MNKFLHKLEHFLHLNSECVDTTIINKRLVNCRTCNDCGKHRNIIDLGPAEHFNSDLDYILNSILDKNV